MRRRCSDTDVLQRGSAVNGKTTWARLLRLILVGALLVAIVVSSATADGAPCTHGGSSIGPVVLKGGQLSGDPRPHQRLAFAEESDSSSQEPVGNSSIAATTRPAFTARRVGRGHQRDADHEQQADHIPVAVAKRCGRWGNTTTSSSLPGIRLRLLCAAARAIARMAGWHRST